MVSVWMITYNHEPFIAQAIESVLMQKTTFSIELVIGEDCSTDGTAAIVKEYADKYPHIIRARFNQPNLGMIPNMIKTLEECKGKYIALLEGDDYWTDDEKLQRQVDVLETDDSLVLCYHAVSDLFANGIVKRYKRPLFDGDRLVKDVDINCSFLPTLSVVFRNGVINYGSFPNVFNADAFLFGLLSEHGNAYFLDILAGVYRIHDGGISRSIQSDRSHLKLISTYELLLRELPQKYHSNIKNMIVGTSYNLVINKRRFFNWISLKYYFFLFFYCIKYWRISFFLGHSLKLVLDRIGKI